MNEFTRMLFNLAALVVAAIVLMFVLRLLLSMI